MIKNIRVIILVLVVMVLAGCKSNQQSALQSGEEVTMFVATDIHYLAESLNDKGDAFQAFVTGGDGRQFNYLNEITYAFTNDVEKQKPDVLIISGDLTINGEKATHLEMAQMLAEIEKAGTSVYVIPGNHDILNPWARKFEGEDQLITESINQQEFADIYKGFGYSEALSRDEATLSYLAATSDDVWLLMLDTSQYLMNVDRSSPAPNGKISEETLEWIKTCSESAKAHKAQLVTVMHHNLVDHSELLNFGFTLDNSEEVIETFQALGLNLVLSGHIHIQDIKTVGEGDQAISDIVTSSLIVYPQQYGVLKYVPSQGFEYTSNQVNVEGWAKEEGSTDDNLLQFEKYSKDYFTQHSSKKAHSSLEEVGIYTEEEMALMIETMGLLNGYYFGGTVGAVKEELIQSEGYQLWLKAEKPAFLKKYIMSMIPEDNRVYTQFHIPLQE